MALLLLCCLASLLTRGEGFSGSPDDFDLKPLIAALTTRAGAEVLKQTATHPLDPITFLEYFAIQRALQGVPANVDCSTAPVDILMPNKTYARTWTSGAPFRFAQAQCNDVNDFTNIQVILRLPSATIISTKRIASPIFRSARQSRPSAAPRPRWNINTTISQALLLPASTERKFGVGFTVRGGLVKWGNWQFHVRWDARVGAILSLLRYNNGGASDGKPGVREVIYEMHVSEVYVPYLSPLLFSDTFQAGTYGLGTGSDEVPDPLIPNNDCPKGAVYLHGMKWLGDDVEVFPNTICIFERYAGDPSWRHSGDYVKAEVTLVVRTLSVISNYDYLFDYEFKMDGSIKPQVSMTGYPTTQTTNVATLSAAGVDPTKDGTDRFSGTFVGRNLVAPVSEHFFNYRIDFDVDGPSNSFVEAKYVAAKGIDEFVGTYEYVKVVKTTAATEAKAVYTTSLDKPSDYLIINPSKRTSLGNVVGYQIHSSTVARSFKSGLDEGGACAPWSRNQFYVTLQRYNEKYASGTYVPCFGNTNDGLAAWSKRTQSVKNKDIVVWHTIGFRHNPSQETWPFMARSTASYIIEPYNFFESYPLQDLPTWKDADFVAGCQ